MSEPIKAYKALQEFIFRLKREDLIISSDDRIKVSNISASAVLARPIRLNQLYYRLPSSIEQIQPPEERSNSLRFTLTEDNIHVNKYDDGRLATGINMHVSVFNTGTIQIKGARHPKMIDRAIEVILESITEDCII
ncbi:hypothetical protein [Haloarcula sp. Atlit-7R]|uniref:hypothetical protein n=1 Tax=Haloarcula sp. Atlit-7R TaxID=2282125 RepID=UPI0013145478|nr:hypothetical protein [Haloarcula sp. Atlit-7R]